VILLSLPLRRAGALPVLALLALAAAPAGAAPVFEGTLIVDPAVISPNGDFVQDLATIRYTVAVDSAQVEIRLVPAAGGASVAVIQPLSIRGKGAHQIVYDGAAPGGGTVPDGAYQVRLFGTGLKAEGNETQLKDLRVDATPPAIVVQVVTPASGVIRDGQLLLVDACLSEPSTSLTADFLALDSAFDPSGLVVTSLSNNCYRIGYTIHAANTREDASEIALLVSALDAAGNRGQGSTGICLSNTPPQVVTRPSIPAGSIPVFANGDHVAVDVTFFSPYELAVTGNFSALDSQFDPGRVTVEAQGGGKYRLGYVISIGNTAPNGDKFIVVRAADPGCGAVSDSVKVRLDKEGEEETVVGDVRVEPAIFSPNGDGVTDVAVFRFNALVDSVQVSLTATVNTGSSSTILRITNGTVYRFGPVEIPWDGTFLGSEAQWPNFPDQEFTVRMRALAGPEPIGQERNLILGMETDRKAPKLVNYTGPSSVKNGDLVNLHLDYGDDPDLSLSVDFSALDSLYAGGGQVRLLPDGKYEVTYRMSAGNPFSDRTGVVVPVTAVDPAGNREVSTLVELCLSNDNPVLVSAKLTGKQNPVKNGDTIQIQARFLGQAPLQVNADLSNLDTGFKKATDGIGIDTGDGTTFNITYKITNGNGQVDGSYPIPITARDPDCGVAVETPITIVLDNAEPERPEFDPIPPVVKEPLLEIGGIALGSTEVEIKINNVSVDTFLVAADRFQGTVELALGENRIAALGYDAAGNRSPQSSVASVVLVGENRIDIPARFSPGDAFTVAVLEPVDRIELRLFNLEGTQIQEIVREPAASLNLIVWDGHDDRGELASSGPYIVVADVFLTRGTTDRLRQAFVFTRVGPVE